MLEQEYYPKNYCARAEDGIAKMRERAGQIFDSEAQFIVGVNGSYARREVTSGSDVDLFFLALSQNMEEVEEAQKAFRAALSNDLGMKMPANHGVFEKPLTIKRLTNSIGGLDDTNENITRRMLLLLEGEWIFNEEKFDHARDLLLEIYVGGGVSKEKIGMFLLNDIMRYWQTICVDYEYKVNSDGKPRAIRLVKLIFSRMLLYSAGVIVVGENFQKELDEKIALLREYLRMWPLRRLEVILGKEISSIVSLKYDFLRAIDDPDIRAKLEAPEVNTLEELDYDKFVQNARKFKSGLFQIIMTRYKYTPLIPSLVL